ncbi:hypothetical protein AGMMS50293_20180 [Spirochaetia bacterium]|nr:hypothetical protein AGMMS50293_20180 [Spirochaetia bacterium]
MTIQSERIDKSSMVLYLSGRLDTATAPQLERKLKQWGDDITELTLDFTELSYISSMGLRVLLQTQKAMKAKDRKLTIKNMNESIREVFEMTGFINLMVQEERFVAIKKEDGSEITLSLIGQMDSTNVPTVATELAQIREFSEAKDTATLLILDVAKLTSLSVGAGKLLCQTIEDTSWPKRQVSIQNASEELKALFTKDGMGDLLDAGNNKLA